MTHHMPANPSTLTDVQLIRRCTDNCDSSCWPEFVARYQVLLTRSATRAYRRFTRGVFPPHWRVAEFVQETYLRLLKNDMDLLRKLRGETESSVKAYLTNIAMNTVGDLMREELAQKRYSETSSLAESDIGTQALLLAREFATPEGLADRDLRKLLANYSDAAQANRDIVIFLLHVRVGLTAHEIAAVDFIRLKPASVTSILTRTKNRLRKALRDAA
jgi:RNA polymerase sigma factor (sigma-70 family)